VNWPEYIPSIAPIVVIGILLVGAYLLARSVAIRLRQRGAQPHQVRGARFAIYAVALLLSAAIFFVAFGPIGVVSSLTFSAILGLAATLALQTTISNVIAGFILLQGRMLRVHDNVQISGIKGQVAQIGLVTTWLHLEDGTVASVSNSTLLGGPLINRTAGDRLKGEY
jgi:small conductance mechanosensitive channel